MMSKESWEEWLEHPVTEQFLKYLKDSANQEVDLLSEGIKGGSILSEKEQVSVSVLYRTLEEISEIDYEEIIDFYTEDK